MVKLNRIYTRTGDDGSTGLVDGSRRAKHDLRLEAIGVVDEANCAIGHALCAISGDAAGPLQTVQNELFDLGADLATPGEMEGALRILTSQVDRLEAQLDVLTAELEPLTSFVLPGGSEAAARLHLARTATRRAERAMTALAAREEINPAALAYINRLSDYLFMLARKANDGGRGDVLWVPGASRA